MRNACTMTALALAIAVSSSLMQVTAASVDRPPPKPNITVRDLLSLKDIGGEQGSIWISPSGRYIAFQLQEADFAANTYRSAWYVAPASPDATLRRVASGGDLMLWPATWGRTNGARLDVEARWSPDEQWIAYLRRDGDQVQVWRARADGTREEQVTHSRGNVMSFAWRPDGKGIEFQVDRDRTELARADREEGERGYLFDDRFMPTYSTKPLWFPCNEVSWSRRPDSEPCVPRIRTALFGSPEREATPAEVQAFQHSDAPDISAIGVPGAIRMTAWNADHTRAAWLENTAPTKNRGYGAPLTLFVANQRCPAPQCRGRLEGIWWRGSDVVFVRDEGWDQSVRTLYRWRPGAGAPRRIYSVDGTLTACGMGRGNLLCLLETPKTPRRIVSIDPDDGRLETVYDPNPEFARFALGHVEKIDVTDGLGHPAFGHLVYPPDYDGRSRYPLVIVQYRSKGFLRGGVGNEYPIYPLAAAGFLVYSSDLPMDEQLESRYGLSPWQDLLAYEAHEYGKNGYRMRRGLGALNAALDQLECRGVLDGSRVGITGLSMGAEVLYYALAHSTQFAAAASSGLSSPESYDLQVNNTLHELGKAQWDARSLPEAIQTASEVYSLAAHLDRFRTPLLLQISDHELIGDLPDYVELKDAGKPTEAYVFPDEYHVKYQPLHKLAVGERVIDWFRFWLKGEEDPAPGKAAQYARWRVMRRQLEQSRERSTSASRPPPRCIPEGAGADPAPAPGPRE